MLLSLYIFGGEGGYLIFLKQDEARGHVPPGSVLLVPSICRAVFFSGSGLVVLRIKGL